MDFDKESVKKTTTDVMNIVFDPNNEKAVNLKDDVKKPRTKYFWIWVWAVIILIMSLGTIGGYYIIKNSNDKIANNYKDSIILYLNDVHDTASSSGSDPSEIGYDVSKIIFPELVKVYIAGFSPDYKQAETIQINAHKAISLLRSKIADCVSVYDFYNQWKNIESKLMEIGNTSSPSSDTYEQFRVTLSQFVGLIDKTVMPKELVAYNNGLRSSAQSLYSSWNNLLDAYKAKNQVAYNVAYDEYSKNSKKVESSIEPYKLYYDSLSSKVKLAADDVKVYEESIK